MIEGRRVGVFRDHLANGDRGVVGPERAEDRSFARDDHLLHPQLPGEEGDGHGRGAATGDDGELTRIHATADGHIQDAAHHVLIDHLGNAEGGIGDRNSERVGNLLLDDLVGQLRIDLHAAVEEVVRRDVPENDIGIGHRGLYAAAHVAGGSG
ncbi:MAG TPA: hypothetical protein PLX70_05795, partial [Solirubrobacterales bacterium]|nr:hypothetical protein [Solirubrobacterales bacterium]